MTRKNGNHKAKRRVDKPKKKFVKSNRKANPACVACGDSGRSSNGSPCICRIQNRKTK